MAFINAINKRVSCSISVVAVLDDNATPMSIVGLVLGQLQQDHGFKNEELNKKTHEEGINDAVVLTNVKGDTITYKKSKNMSMCVC